MPNKVWLVKVEIPVKAESRTEAWEKAQEFVEPYDGTVVSCPQQPVEEEKR